MSLEIDEPCSDLLRKTQVDPTPFRFCDVREISLIHDFRKVH